ncbi:MULTISPECIES: isoleucine--tRNA ligase [Trueperella]|uniref:Isoleucine--tRNA ligase n=1 Tax=Trueperella bernardiae TaxID=59561 RepID=A0A0W1KMF0_9ACTO|nr:MULTISPECIES: isoleucine--tRNA ligase [Trueperella]KTF04717.1 Isoleucine--tRNA ligase [Trueperella bernardiae]MCM3907369.1 isoleucine--tRNA ligase [Trueperella bernardiae]MDK8601338.1 isoleucine--tRNA ligase [Trueperella bernardiae]MDV6238227.1 isoleucine--tRNA ligase [Trueperella bernardiae]OCW61170.1 isoleucine--tRNA ligase [Trueperella bernardiae]
MTSRKYPLHRDGDAVASPNFPQLEEDILAYWEKDDTFQASIDQRTGDEFVFYDGPPFANGLPHYGHLLTGYVKDVIARYQTQQGKRVDREFGWDTHGLPAELEAEKVLGIEDKSEIETMGIEKFNDACRTSVLTYTKEWKEYVTRQARWVDFDNGYKTLDPTFMESVIWSFKTLWDKGLVYEGYRVLPYCWNDQTPLSNHELKMDDDVYQDRQDQTVTVGLRLESGELALIWTTTPWTLPSNLAIAVGPQIDYVTVRPADGPLAGQDVLLAKARLRAYAKELGEDPQVVAEYKGSDLQGKKYYPIFDYYTREDEKPGPNAWQIRTAEYVSTEDGTGLVHIAPYGEDDMFVLAEADIKVIETVDTAGKFFPNITDYAGVNVFEANRPIMNDLRDGTGSQERIPAERRSVLVREQSYVHSYPHCWRCRKPLIYKPVTSWFVAVTQFRDRMVELNQQITWQPEHIKDGIFGNWLAGARDWSISRNRYWGTPIPVWKSDDPAYPRIDVYGSFAELEADFDRLPVGPDGEPNLHRPYIDELTRPNPDDPTGKSTMRRIPDILDVWFDSGSMPYAQKHYPFENQDWFESHFPGDFIVEYIGQTRGWFYVMHVLSTALFDRPAFTSCISHGIVLGNDGRKASKSLRNYPDPMEMYDQYGSDAVRWMLMSSPVLRGGNLVVNEESIREAMRHVILPLWNTWYFFALYAGTCNKGEGYVASPIDVDDAEALASLDVMDRYLLSRTKLLADAVKADLDGLDIPAATQEVRGFIDLLTNWYVRTSRDRFWNEDEGAFDTLYTALETLMRVSAPLLPLVAEEIWRGLTGGRSVHMTDWPTWPEHVVDADLVKVMDEVRDVVSHAHSLRKAHSLRVRQPLRSLTVVTGLDLAPFASLIASEVNVKEVKIQTAEESGLEVRKELTVLPRELEPAVRRHTSALFKAAREGAWELEGDRARMLIDPVIVLEPGQFEATTAVEAAEGSVAEVLDSGAFVVLDTVLDPDLEAEGYARDVVRAVQDQRKADGLHVADRIRLTLRVPDERVAAVEANLDMITAETLALEASVSGGADTIDVNVEKL